MEFTDKEVITHEDPEINVLYLLNEYADKTQDYKNAFLDSCDLIFRESGMLSGKQINTLVKIYNSIPDIAT